jgi:hypothetical protein
MVLRCGRSIQGGRAGRCHHWLPRPWGILRENPTELPCAVGRREDGARPCPLASPGAGDRGETGWPLTPRVARPRGGLSAGSLREPTRRISCGGAVGSGCEVHEQGGGRLSGGGGAGDAPWGGREAPARSAPVHHPRQRFHGFRFAAPPPVPYSVPPASRADGRRMHRAETNRTAKVGGVAGTVALRKCRMCRRGSEFAHQALNTFPCSPHGAS